MIKNAPAIVDSLLDDLNDRSGFALTADVRDMIRRDWIRILSTTTLIQELTEQDVVDALAKGRIERKIAEGDHAWRSLVERNEKLDSARDELVRIATAYVPSGVLQRVDILAKVGK